MVVYSFFLYIFDFFSVEIFFCDLCISFSFKSLIFSCLIFFFVISNLNNNWYGSSAVINMSSQHFERGADFSDEESGDSRTRDEKR